MGVLSALDSNVANLSHDTFSLIYYRSKAKAKNQSSNG